MIYTDVCEYVGGSVDTIQLIKFNRVLFIYGQLVDFSFVYSSSM